MSAFGVPACTGDAPQGIAPVPFKVACSPKSCEGRVQIGVFFDGTSNHGQDDKDKDLSHSNVARLWAAYSEQKEIGIYKSYIEGVGARCPRVGENVAHPNGGKFAAGGKARMCLGLIELFNSVYLYISGGDLLVTEKQSLAVKCRVKVHHD